ncbi:MAG: glycosyltransferase family 2 protein [Gammaproteobacteria bacterium]|nr:glycosyltransferase family 2 protein [Gammaproteobacteria bacterium]
MTIAIPAYNEEENIYNAIQSALNSSYPNLYIIVVNDASTDNTMKIIDDHFQLVEVPAIIEEKIPCSKIKAVYVSKTHSNLMIIDKEKNTVANGGAGAGDSFNIAINACFTPYFMTLDADSLIDSEAINEFIYDIMTHPTTVIVGGGVYILNDCKVQQGRVTQPLLPLRLVPGIQAVEYIRSHLFGRTGWNPLGGTMCYSGTATMLDRKVVIDAKGFDAQNYGQDVDIIMRINAYMHKSKKPYKVMFNPVATIWTDAPRSFTEFGKQRDKWRRGMLRSTIRYWYMFLNPRYGIQGMIGYPAYIILEVLAPLIEFTSYFTLCISLYLGILNLKQTLLYVTLAWGFVTYISIANMFINLITFNRYKKFTDILRIFSLTVLETFGFRQFNVLVMFYGTIHYLVNRIMGKPL